jgi:hypothetical protein
MVRRRTLSAVFAVATLCWAAIILAVPYALSHDARGTLAPRLAVAVYLTGSFVCHQQDQRSFHPWGVKMPVCARCLTRRPRSGLPSAWRRASACSATDAAA